MRGRLTVETRQQLGDYSMFHVFGSRLASLRDGLDLVYEKYARRIRLSQFELNSHIDCLKLRVFVIEINKYIEINNTYDCFVEHGSNVLLGLARHARDQFGGGHFE